MKILVTGATGFIGLRAARHLASVGHSVIGTGRKASRETSALQSVEWILGFLEDPAFCRKITHGVDAVLHCAGRAGTWGSYEDFHLANVRVTENILRAARDNSVHRFVMLSSPSIYFDFCDQLDLREGDLPPRPSNDYAKTKLESEILVLRENRPDFLTIALRPRFVIGAGDANVLPRLIALQETGKLVEIGTGKSVVSVTSIANLLQAIDLCLSCAPDAMGEVYNVADPEPIEFWKLVDQVTVALGKKIEPRKRLPRAPLLFLARINEKVCRLLGVKKEPKFLPLSIGVLSQSMTLNLEKSCTKLGYIPKNLTRESILEFATWWKSRR